MENPTSIIISLILSLLAISISIPTVRSQLSVTPILAACPGLPISSKIRVYVQDILSGPNQTVYPVANSSISATSPSNFGVIRVADDKLTAGPDYNSPEVGRAQGLVTTADLREVALAMNVNFFFTDGKFNGSTLSVLGRNPVFVKPLNRELAVVGGTGIFRCAKGSVFVDTISFDNQTWNGVYSYTFYITYNKI